MGRGRRDAGGVPPQAREQIRDAERLADRLRAVGGDSEAILDCTQAATP